MKDKAAKHERPSRELARALMVSEYGGRIDVQSTKGAGSTFKVLMPLAGVKSLQAG